jgi:hypothetical protein
MYCPLWAALVANQKNMAVHRRRNLIRYYQHFPDEAQALEVEVVLLAEPVRDDQHFGIEALLTPARQSLNQVLESTKWSTFLWFEAPAKGKGKRRTESEAEAINQKRRVSTAYQPGLPLIEVLK